MVFFRYIIVNTLYKGDDDNNIIIITIAIFILDLNFNDFRFFKFIFINNQKEYGLQANVMTPQERYDTISISLQTPSERSVCHKTQMTSFNRRKRLYFLPMLNFNSVRASFVNPRSAML